MSSTRLFVAMVVAWQLGLHAAPAQELSRYRGYALDSSLGVVTGTSGARAADVRTLHTRPASIQELEWRAPYVGTTTTHVDPIRGIVFAFYNDALYQMVVSYDRDRTEGLTDADIIDSVSAAYGTPARPAKGRAIAPPEAFPDRLVLARWEDATSMVTLLRGEFAPDVQLVVASKATSMEARKAAREALRLDALDAPRRESEQRQKDARDAVTMRATKRATNKEAFRP